MRASGPSSSREQPPREAHSQHPAHAQPNLHSQQNAGSRPSWERFLAQTLDLPSLGMRLDLSRMGLPDREPDDLQPALQTAIEHMAALERGAIANPDEKRPVGHYWLRSPDLAPDPATGQAIRQALLQIKNFAAGVHAGQIGAPRSAGSGPAPRFRHFLLIGIGGSALGPQLLDDALSSPGAPMRAHFLDNTDPDGIDRVLAELEPVLGETLIIVISKSGGTKETRNGMLEVEAALKRAGRRLGPQAVAVTMPGSDLERYARETGFLAVVPIWEWVGGRFSVTSPVGLLPAALQGFDVDAFLEGAREMDALTRAADPARNPAALLARAWHTVGRGRGLRDMVVLPYCDRLLLFSRYLQQLVMESLGKEFDLRGNRVHQGLAVYGNKGSTDQHAFVQQLREGPDDFFVTFIASQADRDLGSRTSASSSGHSSAAARRPEPLHVDPGVTTGDYLLGFLLGTREALTEAGRPSLLLTLPDVRERSLGALIALYERTVGLYASLIGVNAYHQPGVEAGKRAASETLDLQRRLLDLLGQPGVEAATARELAARLDPPADAELAFHLLEHLAANGRIRVLASEPWWDKRFARPE
ncbi:MAG: glucose-6-phosphate isomerase [Candidatus Eisenbacteria bacterium]